MPTPTLILILILVFLAIAAYFTGKRIATNELARKHDAEIVDLKDVHEREKKAAIEKSLSRSRNTIKGKISEQLAPILPGFPYAGSDFRFLGDPIDGVVFNGYTALKEDFSKADELEVVIVEIKTGSSCLKKYQRAIREAVTQGRVRFEVVRISDAGEVSTKTFPNAKNKLSMSA